MANGWMNGLINRNRPLPAFLLVVRPLNLLFIALTQYLLFFHFLFPILHAIHQRPVLDGWRGWLFIATTTLLAAAGYVINDLYDVGADRINKPGKWWVGRTFSRRAAIRYAGSLLLLGGLAAALIASNLQKWHLWLIYPAVAILLWAYSRWFKGIALAGNALVALLCSLVAGMVWYAELPGFQALNQKDPMQAGLVVQALGLYLLFAFLATLFREIVKDCEDMEGDAAMALRTLPVALGMHAGRLWGFATGLLLQLTLVILIFRFLLAGRWMEGSFVAILLAIPLGVGLVVMWRAQTAAQFHQVSSIAKWVIFAGVFLILLLP